MSFGVVIIYAHEPIYGGSVETWNSIQNEQFISPNSIVSLSHFALYFSILYNMLSARICSTFSFRARLLPSQMDQAWISGPWHYGNNYLSWIIDGEIHPYTMEWETQPKKKIKNQCKGVPRQLFSLSTQRIKLNILLYKDPLHVWKNLKERYNHQEAVILPKARLLDAFMIAKFGSSSWLKMWIEILLIKIYYRRHSLFFIPWMCIYNSNIEIKVLEDTLNWFHLFLWLDEPTRY